MRLRLLVGLLAFLGVGLAVGCEDRADRHKETTDSTPPPARQEGPAERTGRIVDQATRQAAEAVGKGLEKAGKEVQRNVPEPRQDVPPEPDPDRP